MRRTCFTIAVLVAMTGLGCATKGDEAGKGTSAVEQMQAACERAATRQKLSLRGAMTNRRHVGTGLWVGEYSAVEAGTPLARRGTERRLLCEYNEGAQEATLR